MNNDEKRPQDQQTNPQQPNPAQQNNQDDRDPTRRQPGRDMDTGVDTGAIQPGKTQGSNLS
jgi:hypothetical protein